MSNIRLIFGFHAVTSRLRQNPDSIKEVFLDSTRRDQRARDLTKMAETQNVRLILCDSARLASMAGGARHQALQKPERHQQPKHPPEGYFALENNATDFVRHRRKAMPFVDDRSDVYLIWQLDLL